jgi:hypothetical protein
MNIALGCQLSALSSQDNRRRSSGFGRCKSKIAVRHQFIQTQKCSGDAAGAFGFPDG